MNKRPIFPVFLITGLLAFGCEKKSETITVSVPAPTDLRTSPPSATTTLETKKLGLAIDQYISTPSAEKAANVKIALADLDGEIAELEARVAQTTGADRAEAQGKLTNLQAYRAAETARYTAAVVPPPVNAMPLPADTRTGAEKVEGSLENAGNKLENTAEKIGQSIKNGAENVGDKIKDATGN